MGIFASVWGLLKVGTWGERLAFVGVIALALFGLYTLGHHNGYAEGKMASKVVIAGYKEKKAATQEKIAKEQIKINDEVAKDRSDAREVITKRQTDNQLIITKYVPQQYWASKGWVAAHNAMALNESIDPVLAADPTPSLVSSTDVLSVVGVNYSMYYKCLVDLKAWDDWYVATDESLKKFNAEAKK